MASLGVGRRAVASSGEARPRGEPTRAHVLIAKAPGPSIPIQLVRQVFKLKSKVEVYFARRLAIGRREGAGASTRARGGSSDLRRYGPWTLRAGRGPRGEIKNAERGNDTTVTTRNLGGVCDPCVPCDGQITKSRGDKDYSDGSIACSHIGARRGVLAAPESSRPESSGVPAPARTTTAPL